MKVLKSGELKNCFVLVLIRNGHHHKVTAFKTEDSVLHAIKDMILRGRFDANSDELLLFYNSEPIVLDKIIDKWQKHRNRL